MTVAQTKPKTTTLSPRESTIYDALRTRGDVTITALYRAAFANGGAATTPRAQQQALGPYIARMNQKLDREKVVLGIARRSYRLESVTA